MESICRRLIRGWDSPADPSTRARGGNVASAVGIVTNILLFAGKFAAGALSGSIALKADALNNLSDAGSSVISLISFRLASRPADRGHPFGHARYEYLASLAVAVLILLLGYELARSSIDKILSPDAVEFSALNACVLVAAMGVKLWLYLFYRRVGRRIGSPVLEAAAMDSISDVLASAGVLLSTVVSPLIGFQLDGYMGVVVAGFIVYTAIKIVIEALNDLLGAPASPEVVERIADEVRKCPGVLGIHDMIVHDYGPGHRFASLHAEVSASEDIMASHDMIDNIERSIKRDLGVDAVIHMDPIVVDDPRVNELREFARSAVRDIDARLTLHDFRVVIGHTHTNCIFDVLAPYDCALTDEEIVSMLERSFSARDGMLYAVPTIDRSYVAGRAD